MTNYTFRFFPNKQVYADWYNDVRQNRWLGKNDGVAWTTECNDVNINITGIDKWAIKNNISFNDMLSHAISHEILHNILNDTLGTIVSRQFDNICYIRNKKFKTWIGGIG